MRTAYELAAATAVQLKRVVSGLYGQTRFTKYLENIQYLPQPELKVLQAVRLCKILTHAVENVPFYFKLKGEFLLSPDTVFNDIIHFPIVTREMLADQPEIFTAHKERYIKKLQSGGTTSQRVYVLRDKISLTDRPDEYFNKMIGIFPGMSRLIINRHESHYYSKTSEEIEYYENRLSRTYLVNPTFFDEDKLKRTYNFLIEKKPKIIRANSTFVYEFARAIENNNWEAPHVPIIEGSCVTMQPHYISTLERVFGASVYDVYGATEINTVCCQCEKKESMHYVPVCHYMEIRTDSSVEAENGETGELIVTSLSHKAMPIIRYQIGDYATHTDEMCKCGRTFPLIKRIDGRVVETIRSKIGTYITVHEVTKILEEVGVPTDFQVIQEEEWDVKINLKLFSDKLTFDRETFIKNRFCEIIGDKMDIQINYVSEFIKQHNGKILRIISMSKN